jgi:endonuclease/exonuclease/phosphatase family metal-dependent hydrolase
MPYVHEYFTKKSLKNGKKAGVGTAIYSKYKILNKGEVLFDNEKSNHCTYVDILKNDDTIRVYNAHLGSIRFDYDDYTFIAREKKQSIEEEMMPLKKIAKRLKIGFEKRVGQVSQLLEHVKNSPYATVIGADMNDTPISYSYEQFSASLMDSFNEKGNWVGSTYIGAIPLLRIDYLWHNDRLENCSFTTINKEYSDHRPIIGEYSIVH